jgi:hypothetical protein
VPIALGVAYSIFLIIGLIACEGAHACWDLNGLPYFILGAIAGIVVGTGFWMMASRLGGGLRRRLSWDGAAIALTIAASLMPYVLEWQTNARHARESAAANQAFIAARMDWIRRLQRDAHGPAGQVPPALRVVDDGTTAIVTNASSTWIVVALARVQAVPGGWRACAMSSTGEFPMYWASLAAGKTMRFVPKQECAAAFAGAPLEYRVGKDQRSSGWWSDSAFAAPDGREHDTGQ